MELGVYTFGDVARDPHTGTTISPQQRLSNLIEEIELADQVGLDVFGVGEHHRPDYAVSAPAAVLAAAAVRTTQIRLTSAVTVLSSEDPVRVFQQYSTVDLLSGGRAEIMAGKLVLLLQLRDSVRVTWSCLHRAALADQPVYPRPVQDPLPVWVAVG